ncbi:signal peptidase I [Paenibacillus thalictri]
MKPTIRLILFLSLFAFFLIPRVYADEPVRVFVNGYQVIYNQLPIVEEGNTIVPFKPSMEALGYTVQWDEATQTITGTAPNMKVELQVNRLTGYINGESAELSAAPAIVKGSTFVPIRFLGEISGGDVTWDPKTNHIDIVTDKGYYVYNEVIRNNTEGAKYWLEQGASANFANKNDGVSSLDLAVHHKNVEMVKLLLEHGAIPDMMNPVHPFIGIQQIDSAIYYKSPEIVKLLIQYGANPQKKDRNGATLAEQVNQNIKAANSEDAATFKEIAAILNAAADIPKSSRYARYFAAGPSMEPTVADNERLWIDKQYYQLHSVLRNDLILFETQGKLYTKRVIGLPTENVSINQEQLLINGQRFPSLVFPGNMRNRNELSLGDNEVFVIGDNYNNSFDSRDIGPVPLDHIVGKVIHIEHTAKQSAKQNTGQTAGENQTAIQPATVKQYKHAPEMTIDDAKKYTAVIHTNKGDFTIELFAGSTPKTVNNFVFLAKEGFYDDVIFHRVIQSFMIQTGDPTGTGRGGPGYKFEDELNSPYSYEPGIVAMANAGPNTNGSQFFICTGEDSRNLAQIPNYTIFGRVTDGMDTVLAIAAVPVATQKVTAEKSSPTEKVVIQNVDIIESE